MRDVRNRIFHFVDPIVYAYIDYGNNDLIPVLAWSKIRNPIGRIYNRTNALVQENLKIEFNG